MVKSKNLGISKACPECRKTLLNSAELTGTGKFKTKCPHCKTLVQVEIGQKNFILLTKAVLFTLILINIYQIYTLLELRKETEIIKTYAIFSK